MLAMSSVKSSSSAGDSTWKELERHDGRGGEIIKMGYLKKLKTMRKKFFVLRGESSEASARLEYYDNEKKWRSHHSPKRTIALKTCFNINRRSDTKHKFVIALYTKDDCFCLVLETEEDLEDWLKALLSLQHGEDVVDGEQPKPTFEHVWQVTVQKKGLGNSRNILGPFLLCLTDKTLSLLKVTQEEKPDTFEFPLMSIRRCGHSDCFFYMEVGRSSCTGAGDIWMQTEDTIIAQNMHASILSAMSNNSLKEELAPRPRTRSSSANEASKPISMLHRRQTHIGSGKAINYYSTSEEVPKSGGHPASVRTSGTTYCEHLPAPSTPDTSHNQVCAGSLPGSFHCHHSHHRAALVHHPPVPVPPVRPSQRRHSVSAMCVSSVAGPAGPTHQRTYSFPLSEPQAPALPPWETRRGSTGRMGKRSGSNVRSSTAGRERCDSMPSRARTTSEGHHQPLPHATRNVHLVPGHGANRPHSMYSRGISYSPPVGSSPVSPASGACSTDSAGSSLSIDDGENWSEVGGSESMLSMGRYGHSLTPDEPVIMEENCDEYGPWPGPGSTTEDKLNYLPMDRTMPSLSLPIQPVVPTSTVSAPHRKISPNLSSSGFKSGSPSQGSYMEMYSPCGSSPLDTTGGYMAMSPGGGGGSVPSEATPRIQMYSRAVSSANHSRGSSLAEDGYVPMAPADGGYIDMDPMQPTNVHEHFQHSEMSPASSCSITSGTPSTDLRFSEYHLEKVSSYFTPSEEDETSSLDRPIRAYSVGSRPEKFKKSDRLEINQAADASRVRAFSVGSRTAPGVKLSSRPLAHDMHTSRYQPTASFTPPSQHHLHSAPSVPGKKSSSAPLLSTSWSGSSTLRHAHVGSHSSGEPMDDLMEMDFTSNIRPLAKGSSSTKAALKTPSLPPYHHQLSTSHDRHSVTPAASTSATSGYMEMTSRSTMVASPKPQTTCGPYVEMRAGSGGDTLASSPPGSIMSARVSPKTSVSSGPYMEMKPGMMGELLIQNSIDSPLQSKPISVVPRSVITSSVSPKTQITVGPYVEMRTGGNIIEPPPRIASSPPNKPTVVTSGDFSSAKSFRDETPYVEMKAGTIPESSSSNVGVARPSSVGAYMEMRAGPGSELQSSQSLLNTAGTSPKSMALNVGPYADMRTIGSSDIHHQNFSPSSSFSTGSKQSASRKPTSPIQEEYMDMSSKPNRKISRQENIGKEPVISIGPSLINRTAPVDTPQPKKSTDGYVEMSWSRGSKPLSKSSLEDYKSSSGAGQEDYMNMSYEGRGSFSGKRKERRGSRKEKNRNSSKPIAIQSAGSGPPKDASVKTSSASTSPVFSFSNLVTPGRKSSTGTPPKIPPAFLPLGGSSSPSTSPFSSLSRKRSTKGSSGQRSEGGSRRESCDMNSGLTTPTGSTATIFPFSLNSPGSPMKPFPGTTTSKSDGGHGPSNKCPVDATSGTVRILYSYPEMQLSTSSAGSTPATPESSSSSEQPTPVNTESVDDITKADDTSESHDYVNFSPLQSSRQETCYQDRDVGDYTMMRPVSAGTAHEIPRKISAPAFGVSNRRVNSIHQGITGVALSSPSLSSTKTVAPMREATPPFTRKSSFNQPLATTLFCPTSKLSTSEVSNGPKIVTHSAATNSKGTAFLSRQLSNTGSSSSDLNKTPSMSTSKESVFCGSTSSNRGICVGRQLSRSSSGSSETGRNQSIGSIDSGKSQEDKGENLLVKSDGDSGTISPASSQTTISSRPPSVSSERELHYASLDLAPSGSEGEEGAKSPRSFKTQSSLTESSTSSPSPNPINQGAAGETFSYAEIDFAKSEGLRNASSSLNRKVRH